MKPRYAYGDAEVAVRVADHDFARRLVRLSTTFDTLLMG